MTQLQNTRSILIVDDNWQLLKTLELTFLKRSYQMLTASSGDQAVKMLQNGAQPDLLLTDAVMPGRRQGKDVAQAFKNLWPDRYGPTAAAARGLRFPLKRSSQNLGGAESVDRTFPDFIVDPQ